MAATVDYLFRLRRHDQRRRRLDVRAAHAVLRSTRPTGEFLDKSNPWALHGITERLLEAAQRDLWESPPPEMLDELRRIYLQTEGDIEGRAGE